MPSRTRSRQGRAQTRKPQTKAAPAKVARKTAARKQAAPLKSARAKSSRDKVKAHRKRMRDKGFRLFQMWLPDISTPEFRAQAHKAAQAIANSPEEAEIQAFLDSVSWLNSEEARALAEREPPPEKWWRESSD
jgi:hypothetical protein